MGFAVMHFEKSKNASSGLGRHIDRKHTPKNCDETKSHLNRFYDPRKKGAFDYGPPKESLNQRINNRIKEGYTAPRKIRSNAVRSINFILTGSNEDMIKIFKDPEESKLWIRNNFEFLADEFGGIENIVSFALHMDEKTPHIHATVVPITEDGRLSARDFIGDRKKMQQLQDLYAEKMKPFDLERGIKGSRAEHTTTKEYYSMIEKPVKMSQNLTVEEKANLADRYLAEHINRLLEEKKKAQYGKSYRENQAKKGPKP